jgi:hypothetical protein
MKIVKQSDQFNQFNIEGLTLGRVLSIINALEHSKQNNLLNTAGGQLLESLKKQFDPIKI